MNAATENAVAALDRAMAAALRDGDHAFEPVEVDRLVLSDDGPGLEDANTANIDTAALADDDGTEAAA